MKADKSSARVTLDRNEWIEAAIDVLAEQGVQGMRIEVLAKNFGVTKGSFYWHFKDRQDLVDGVLQTWRDGRIRDIDKQTGASPGREREQLLHLIDVYGATRNRKGISIELAVREWARRDAQAAAIVEEVDSWRLQCTRQLFVRRGVSDEEAKSRSLLLYAYVFGQSLMACERYDPAIGELKRWIAELIVKE
ncbi:MAG: putative HTH-type transcriptional regulator TtgW [Candidatus Accumulibacter regalis]|jgi:AcrR family transcriptional regulator|uniref:HTH-type transcriptional regulator TtgW n=1 Tax=Accumulibacter regalis TaxID=522306 RepID=A0A011RG88_ACCRE|nr:MULTISPECIES: TetR/AcrR family transcriptional regulator [unclassified Candidatus Accumulibacter]EXI90234.1 MAG: putative HTH-type transcriptional regulator TtgW [Candidatus Accumulibacter regalis]MQM34088.1 TetR/AcrR family transcriptional regulator [Candidatus Accumulibacter phosphatis]MBL8367732.1 TetR/AcrR family transcriptional regulator [Accumulibacter sp.]MBN8515934.1 TetR/AcrR family transcriptional regulator [Accumulibacter sp.]MBO3703905.1 TetR/AcrR family transcriptional regulato